MLNIMDSNMKIERITQFRPEFVEEINALLPQLSPDKVFTAEQLRAMLEDKNVYLLGLFDGEKLVGTATLILLRQVIGTKATVEDVVVDYKYRGRGLGEDLMNELLRIAKELKVRKVMLTSGPDRIVARKLYEKLGFTIKDTSVFHIKF